MSFDIQSGIHSRRVSTRAEGATASSGVVMRLIGIQHRERDEMAIMGHKKGRAHMYSFPLGMIKWRSSFKPLSPPEVGEWYY